MLSTSIVFLIIHCGLSQWFTTVRGHWLPEKSLIFVNSRLYPAVDRTDLDYRIVNIWASVFIHGKFVPAGVCKIVITLMGRESVHQYNYQNLEAGFYILQDILNHTNWWINVYISVNRGMLKILECYLKSFFIWYKTVFISWLFFINFSLIIQS